MISGVGFISSSEVDDVVCADVGNFTFMFDEFFLGCEGIVIVVGVVESFIEVGVCELGYVKAKLITLKISNEQFTLRFELVPLVMSIVEDNGSS